MGDDAAEGARYRAFISYSHVDQAFGRRLHRRLERYVLPRRLVGRITARGPVPRRVAPVFRDREEFSAAGDLTAEVRAALAASGALIVVCSPAAAASPWVGREIELFRVLHPDRPVLAAIAGGEPRDCFPAALTTTGGTSVEPLAADFRPHADGPRLGLLKLVAGVAGVGLDELVQRDAQRRMLAVTAVTSGAIAVALAMTALTTFAVLAQREAERQRGQAEALVEFMLTDLRDRLKGVGRLDVLTSVNERTLAYYADQQVADLPPESRARYARILHAMGEDDVIRGDLDAAVAKFRTAEGVTAALLAAKPDDPERIWAQGQSEYWLGYDAYLRKDRAAAGDRWRRYRALSGRLAAMAPRNPKYRRELAYAEGNLCTLALAKPPALREALSRCGVALAEMQATARLSGPDAGVALDVINRHGWLGQAHEMSGEWPQALRIWRAQEGLIKAGLAADPRNTQLQEKWIAVQRQLARAEIALGDPAAGRARLVAAHGRLLDLIRLDPENQTWRGMRERVEASLNQIRAPKREPRGTMP